MLCINLFSSSLFISKHHLFFFFFRSSPLPVIISLPISFFTYECKYFSTLVNPQPTHSLLSRDSNAANLRQTRNDADDDDVCQSTKISSYSYPPPISNKVKVKDWVAKLFFPDANWHLTSLV